MLETRKAAWVLAGLLLVLFLKPAYPAETAPSGNNNVAEAAFTRAVTAWKEERFEDLYDQGSRRSKRFVSRSEFVKLMKNSNVRLQCCWSTVQGLRKVAFSAGDTVVAAKLGYEFISPVREPGGGSSVGRWNATASVKEDTFLLSEEEGRWRIDLSDILAAGGYVFAYPPLNFDRPGSLSFNPSIIR